MLDCHHPSRPINTLGKPWFIEDTTGRSYCFEEVRSRVQGMVAILVEVGRTADSIVRFG